MRGCRRIGVRGGVSEDAREIQDNRKWRQTRECNGATSGTQAVARVVRVSRCRLYFRGASHAAVFSLVPSYKRK